MAGMGNQCIVLVRSKGQDLAGLQRQWEQLTPRATGSLWKELFRRLGGGRRMTGVCAGRRPLSIRGYSAHGRPVSRWPAVLRGSHLTDVILLVCSGFLLSCFENLNSWVSQ